MSEKHPQHQEHQEHQKHSQHQEHKEHRQRTTWQTIALIYVILHGFLFTAVSRSFSKEGSTLFLSLFVLASLATIVSGIVMWLWKRWGLYLYAVASIAIAVLVLLDTGSMIMLFGSILPPIIVAYIMMPALKYFD